MDTQAFQHLLSLFPLLTLRQRRLAQQELTTPHPVTSLAAQLPACQWVAAHYLRNYLGW